MSKMSCKVKVIGTPPDDYLHFQIFYRRMRFWQTTGLKNSPQNRELVEATARVISQEIKDENFSYVKWFPKGNKAHLFSREQSVSPSLQTVQAYYENWIEQQAERVRPHRLKDYDAIPRHVLKARVGGVTFGKIALGLLRRSDMQALQNKLKAKGLKASSVNGIIHSCLAAMLTAARVDGLIDVNLYDRGFFKRLPLTDTKPSVDPYTAEEREIILEAFRTKRPHYYRFVFFHFWQGPRPSESTALRREDMDLRYATARIHASRVQGMKPAQKQ